jgi:hypothetical protein
MPRRRRHGASRQCEKVAGKNRGRARQRQEGWAPEKNARSHSIGRNRHALPTPASNPARTSSSMKLASVAPPRSGGPIDKDDRTSSLVVIFAIMLHQCATRVSCRTYPLSNSRSGRLEAISPP